MNEVSVTILPHPITTFILGAMLFALIFLFLEFKRLRGEVKTFHALLAKVENQYEKLETSFDNKLEDVSKKVDSRVDKAIVAVKRSLK